MGTKAVIAGVEQSKAACQAIEALAQSVTDSYQTAGTILMSSEQQVQGVEQVTVAMTNIEKAVQQNLSGTSELREMVQHLDELGVSLKHLVERYRL